MQTPKILNNKTKKTQPRTSN